MGVTTRDGNANQLSADRLTNKIFVWGNDFATTTFLNNTGAELTLIGGEVLGRIGSTLNAVPVDAGSILGDEFVLGVNKSCVTIANGATAQITFALSGDVAEDLLIFINGEDLDTLVLTRPYRDRFGADTKGLRPVSSIELTKFDN